MKGFLVGLVIGALAVLAGELLFMTQGGMPVSTRASPLPMERSLAGRALQVAIAGEAGRTSPLPPDEANLLAGAKVYQNNCAVCHGLRDPASRTTLAKGMYPPPPALLEPGKGVTDDPVGETFWKVRNGIRLTGMPRFEDALSENEMWQVSLLLLKADGLPPAVQQALK
jgi:mono/diheme cytochrome c family protein